MSHPKSTIATLPTTTLRLAAQARTCSLHKPYFIVVKTRRSHQEKLQLPSLGHSQKPFVTAASLWRRVYSCWATIIQILPSGERIDALLYTENSNPPPSPYRYCKSIFGTYQPIVSSFTSCYRSFCLRDHISPSISCETCRLASP